ncbi:MAG: hypothetical protein EAZ95_20040 [Bacteroidetes bacterium]|nr:MAG: hypothetical protein EAZ95_20040 [Bacteroidota bacterium]
MPLLKILPAYATNTFNLYEHWLMPCLQQAQDFDAICVLRQYAKLIKSLNINSLDMESIEEFYNLLQENNGANWQNALAVREMLEEMPLYLAERIKAKYEDEKKFSPFPKLWIHSKNKANAYPVFFSTLKYLGYLIQLEIQCRDVKINSKNEAPYEIFFRDINNPPIEIITYFHKELSILKTFEGKEHDISKKVGSEEEVFKIINKILEDLRKLPALPAGG